LFDYFPARLYYKSLLRIHLIAQSSNNCSAQPVGQKLSGKATFLFTWPAVRVYTKIRYVFLEGTVWRFEPWRKDRHMYLLFVITGRAKTRTDAIHINAERPVNQSKLCFNNKYYLHSTIPRSSPVLVELFKEQFYLRTWNFKFENTGRGLIPSPTIVRSALLCDVTRCRLTADVSVQPLLPVFKNQSARPWFLKRLYRNVCSLRRVSFHMGEDVMKAHCSFEKSTTPRLATLRHITNNGFADMIHSSAKVSMLAGIWQWVKTSQP
jgi:hypothetical protein